MFRQYALRMIDKESLNNKYVVKLRGENMCICF